MLYEPHTCIDHKQDITPFYDVDGYGRCYSNMLCIGYFFLFLLAVVLPTEAGGQALKRSRSGVTKQPRRVSATIFYCCSSAVSIEIAGSPVRPSTTHFVFSW